MVSDAPTPAERRKSVAERTAKLLEAQEGHCATCSSTTGLKMSPAYSRRRVVGILCRRCSMVLDLTHEDASLLSALSGYLKESKMVAPRTFAGREYGVRHLFIIIAFLCAIVALTISVGWISVKDNNDALSWFFGSWLSYLISLFL